jgi:hypothetical protein
MPGGGAHRLRLLASLLGPTVRPDAPGQAPSAVVSLAVLPLTVVRWLKWGAAGLWRPSVERYDSRWALLDAAVDLAPPGGLWLEFGVYRGESVNRIARRSRGPVFGFDSFEGLPSTWTPLHSKGAFSLSGSLPAVEGNVRLIKGWFSDTLPSFLRSHGDARVSFLHIDSDLYSSARFVLSALAERIRRGTVIVFDEYLAVVNPDDEARAFREWTRAAGLTFQYIGSSWSGAVAVRIESDRSSSPPVDGPGPYTTRGAGDS